MAKQMDMAWGNKAKSKSTMHLSNGSGAFLAKDCCPGIKFGSWTFSGTHRTAGPACRRGTQQLATVASCRQLRHSCFVLTSSGKFALIRNLCSSVKISTRRLGAMLQREFFFSHHVNHWDLGRSHLKRGYQSAIRWSFVLLHVFAVFLFQVFKECGAGQAFLWLFPCGSFLGWSCSASCSSPHRSEAPSLGDNNASWASHVSQPDS